MEEKTIKIINKITKYKKTITEMTQLRRKSLDYFYSTPILEELTKIFNLPEFKELLANFKSNLILMSDFRVNIGLCGTTSVGKSTFANIMLNKSKNSSILPVKRYHCTSVPIIIHSSSSIEKSLDAVVHFENSDMFVYLCYYIY